MKDIQSLGIRIMGVVALFIGFASLYGAYWVTKNYRVLLLMTVMPVQLLYFSIFSDLLTGMLFVASGVGLFRFKRWGKNVFISLCAYALSANFVLLLSKVIPTKKPYVIVVSFLFYIVLIFYLCLPKIKAHFK